MILETNGALSVFPSAENRPATRGEQGLDSRYDGIPLTLILDGHVQRRMLTMCAKDEAWLSEQLKAQGIEQAKNVLIALLTTQGILLVQEKGENGRLIHIPALKEQEVAW